MYKAYRILLSVMGVAALAWCLPWLYSMLLPEGINDPFVAYSPVSDSFVVSEGAGGDSHIYTVDADGLVIDDNLTKEQRDVLVPQTYFNQLVARGEMPEAVNGDSITVQLLKQNQWTFSSIPHDVNKRDAKVYPIMESMPARFELEDAREAFVFRGGEIKFIDIATNQINPTRSAKFQKVFNERGMRLPLKDINANITTRKPYDEGYLIADADGEVFHMKMQGGQPFLSKVSLPSGMTSKYVYVLENNEPRHLGLISTTDHDLYVIEKEGHRAVRLPITDIDPERDRISIYKTFFNWVVRLRSPEGVRWVAFDSETYRPLGEYARTDSKSVIEQVAGYVFPFALSFTSTSDSYAYPRISDVSWHAVFLNIALALIVMAVSRRRHSCWVMNGIATLFFGIYYFIVFLIIKN